MGDRNYNPFAKVNICLILLFTTFCAPFVSNAQSDDFLIHVVEPGQNLFRIALKYRTTVDELMRWNGLKGNTIRSGQKLIVGRRVAARRPQGDPFDRNSASKGSKSKSETFSRPEYGNTRRITDPPRELPKRESWETKKEDTRPPKRVSKEANLYTLFLGKPNLSGKGAYSFGSGTDQMEKLGHLLTQQEGKGYHKVEVQSFRESPSAYNAFHQRLSALSQKTHPNDVVFLNIYASSEHKTGKVEIISSGESTQNTRGVSSTFREIVRSAERISGKKLIVCDVDVSRQEAQAYINSCNILGEDVAIFLSTWQQNPASQKEKGTWHHGAIFQAITLALEGAADFNRDGKITLTEVDIYINDKVSYLTGGIQYGHMIFHNFSQPDEMVLTRLY